MKTAFHSGALNSLSAADAARVIRDYGYDQVELNAEKLPWAEPHIWPGMPRDEIRELARLGPYSSISGHHATFGSSRDDARGTGISHTIGILQLAVDIGCDHVHVMPGEDSTREGTVQALEAVIPEADRLGVTLSFEAIVNQAVAGLADIEWLLGRIPDLKINFDASHLQVTDGDVLQAAEALAPSIVAVAIKDANGTPEGFMFPPLGEGDINFRAMLDALRRRGFDGVCSVEHEAHYHGNDKRDWNTVLKESRTFVSQLIGA